MPGDWLEMGVLRLKQTPQTLTGTNCVHVPEKFIALWIPFDATRYLLEGRELAFLRTYKVIDLFRSFIITRRQLGH